MDAKYEARLTEYSNAKHDERLKKVVVEAIVEAFRIINAETDANVDEVHKQVRKRVKGSGK